MVLTLFERSGWVRLGASWAAHCIILVHGNSADLVVLCVRCEEMGVGSGVW